MTVLDEHQFEILPSAEASDGFVFGIGAQVEVDEEGFDPGETTWQTQDTVNSRRGVTAFGRDVKTGGTWAWSSHANGKDVISAVQILQDFSLAWAPEALMLTPGAVTALRYQLAGRTRRIFGRPRRYAAPPTNLILLGNVGVEHDFATVDGNTYDDAESAYNLPYVSTTAGAGFVLPAVLPLSMNPATGTGGGAITVGGNARTYPIIRFNGPWINPTFTTPDWTLSWKGSIPPGGWVEVDTRPWVLTCLNQSGASVVSGLDRTAFLEDYWFAPGSSPQISLGGDASSSTVSALVRWRNAWTSL